MNEVDELIQAVIQKIQTNRGIVARSLRFGRLTWRSNGGKVEVDLEPKL
jgi:hypothetical protein